MAKLNAKQVDFKLGKQRFNYFLSQCIFPSSAFKKIKDGDKFY